MVSILPSKISPWQVIGRAIGQDIPRLIQQQQQQQLLNRQNQAVKNQFGPEIASLSPELQKIYIADQLKNTQAQKNQDFLSKLLSGNLSNDSQQEFVEQQPIQQQNIQSQQVFPRQKKQGFDVSQIPDEVIAQLAANPGTSNAARIIQQQKDVSLREKRAQEELALKQKKATPEYQREQHVEFSQAQADVKYNQQLQDLQKQNELKRQTLDRLRELNKKGVTGKPYEKLLEKFGLVNLTSEGRREFSAEVKNLITDIRSILGGQFSQFEFQTILNAYPSADFSQEANSAIMKNLDYFQDIKEKEIEFANKLKKENKGKTPYDFQSQVNEKVREYASSKIPEIKKNSQKIMNEEYGIPEGKTLMFDPNGEPLGVPNEEVEKYRELGATLP